MASDAKVTVGEMEREINTECALIEAMAANNRQVAAIQLSALNRRNILRGAAAYIRRANAVLGPECPKCGWFLRGEHVQYYNEADQWAIFRTHWAAGETVTDEPCFLAFELFARYPEIAKAVSIDVAHATGATENERREG